MGELNPSIDFLDVLTDDIPKGETVKHSTQNFVLIHAVKK